MNFDPVAEIYDATRGLPEGVPERILHRVVEATGASESTRFLEPGIGTGRIALPFILAGYDYTGVDISQGMMARLREKVGDAPNRLTLIEGDVTSLPFADASFDVVIVVHVLHLIPEWQAALREARRVTAPNGYFVLAHNAHPPNQATQEIRRRWSELVREEGGEVRPRHTETEQIEAALTDAGCFLASYRVAGWERPVQPGPLLEQIRERTYSQSWGIPDDVLARVHAKLVPWAGERFGDLDEPLPDREEFIVTVTRWPSE